MVMPLLAFIQRSAGDPKPNGALRGLNGRPFLFLSDPRVLGEAGFVVAGVARVRQLRPGAAGLLRALRGRILEHQQGAGLHFLARTHR